MHYIKNINLQTHMCKRLSVYIVESQEICSSNNLIRHIFVPTPASTSVLLTIWPFTPVSASEVFTCFSVISALASFFAFFSFRARFLNRPFLLFFLRFPLLFPRIPPASSFLDNDDRKRRGNHYQACKKDKSPPCTQCVVHWLTFRGWRIISSLFGKQ